MRINYVVFYCHMGCWTFLLIIHQEIQKIFLFGPTKKFKSFKRCCTISFNLDFLFIVFLVLSIEMKTSFHLQISHCIRKNLKQNSEWHFIFQDWSRFQHCENVVYLKNEIHIMFLPPRFSRQVMYIHVKAFPHVNLDVYMAKCNSRSCIRDVIWVIFRLHVLN
jgi:hypothetical protein